jgi:hypothetical protein
MQYHKIRPGQSKVRISRSEFIRTYNSAHNPSMAMKPIFSLNFMFDRLARFYVFLNDKLFYVKDFLNLPQGFLPVNTLIQYTLKKIPPFL